MTKMRDSSPLIRIAKASARLGTSAQARRACTSRSRRSSRLARAPGTHPCHHVQRCSLGYTLVQEVGAIGRSYGVGRETDAVDQQTWRRAVHRIAGQGAVSVIDQKCVAVRYPRHRVWHRHRDRRHHDGRAAVGAAHEKVESRRISQDLAKEHQARAVRRIARIAVDTGPSDEEFRRARDRVAGDDVAVDGGRCRRCSRGQIVASFPSCDRRTRAPPQAP